MEKKTLPMQKLLDAMAKYESDEWSKADYIHMLKHMTKMLIWDEVSAIKLAHIDGRIAGGRPASERPATGDELLASISAYVDDNYKPTE